MEDGQTEREATRQKAMLQEDLIVLPKHEMTRSISFECPPHHTLCFVKCFGNLSWLALHPLKIVLTLLSVPKP